MRSTSSSSATKSYGDGTDSMPFSNRCLKNASSMLSVILSRRSMVLVSSTVPPFQAVSCNENIMNAFNLIIIGDEILHGGRQDKHFAFFKSLLESKGLRSSIRCNTCPTNLICWSGNCAAAFQTAYRRLLPAASAPRPTIILAKRRPPLWMLPVVCHRGSRGFIGGVSLIRG